MARRRHGRASGQRMAENINTVNPPLDPGNIRACQPGRRRHLRREANDTVFLAGLADNVLALDIQLEAVRKTQKKTAGFANVTVIQADHAELARWLTQPAQIIVFNLGYLPYSSSPADHDA